MAHRAKLYRVTIHRRGKAGSPLPLGQIDSSGKSALEFVVPLLRNLYATSRDGAITIAYEDDLADTASSQIGISLLRGKTGVSSAIQQGGITHFQRTIEHSEAVRAGLLFDLPRFQSEGILVLHVPHNMGYKTVLYDYLQEFFRKRNLTFLLQPIISINALNRALSDGKVKTLKLTAPDSSSHDPAEVMSRFGIGRHRRMSIKIEAGRDMYLESNYLTALGNTNDADQRRKLLKQALRHESLSFDEAEVRVELPDGTTRTFKLEEPDGGHPMSIPLNIQEAPNSEEASEPNYGADVEQLSTELLSARHAANIE